MGKTILIQKSASGRVAFRAETPGHMTRKEIRRECKKWKVSMKGLIIIYE